MEEAQEYCEEQREHEAAEGEIEKHGRRRKDCRIKYSRRSRRKYG